MTWGLGLILNGITINEEAEKKELKKEHYEECVICMEVLDTNKNFAKTACEHSFCLTCLVKSLKHNNTCPLCRANIDDGKPSNTDKLSLDEGVDMINDEIHRFCLQDHVDTITMFDNPVTSMQSSLRLFGLKLVNSFIDFQKDEDEDEDEYEDEDEMI
jgi:hypothetical protein